MVHSKRTKLGYVAHNRIFRGEQDYVLSNYLMRSAGILNDWRGVDAQWVQLEVTKLSRATRCNRTNENSFYDNLQINNKTTLRHTISMKQASVQYKYITRWGIR